MTDSLIMKGKGLLDEQLQVYGLDGSVRASSLNDGINRYQLAIDGLHVRLSVLNVQGYEHLNEPWRYIIQFTSQHALTMEQVLSEKAVFALAPDDDHYFAEAKNVLSDELMSAFNAFGGMFSDKLSDKSPNSWQRYGVVTAFSQLAASIDETRYEITLSPRLALLDNTINSAIYQNQTVPQVVETILRHHELTGVDFRFELNSTYPIKEYITQWQESDLAFIRRLLADSGIWFRFETHSEHNCDVVVFGDSEQQYQDGATAAYRPPSGNYDNAVESVWEMSVSHKTVPHSVVTQDYNYRSAQADMKSEVNGAQKDKTTRGQHYLYGEHYRDKSEMATDINEEGTSCVGQGDWYARLHHQRLMTEQITVRGKTNLFHLLPGQILTVTHSPVHEANSGLLIIAIESTGGRQEAYHISFTAIPYDVLRPYRPERLTWPVISGTLPARVISPANDIYSYIDAQGRYRVKMDFDLNSTWRKGEESIWMRLAKPYAGETYGMHFPLIDGTEVAIAFTEGNPDRPYIAHGMHDSRHPDLVTIANHKRNIIRSPANNKLRMDDERGKEHIKVATEYGKTQLNLGHLVDAERQQRGEGFELRTDEWGAIRAGKGLYITSEEQPKAQNQQLTMDSAIVELEQSQKMVEELNRLALTAKAELADIQRQKALLEASIKALNSQAILSYAPAGIASVSSDSIQLTAGESIIQTAQNNISVNAFQKFTVIAGNVISLFAEKFGIKLFSSKGEIDIQAQNNRLNLSAKHQLSLTSQNDAIVIKAGKKIVLTSGAAAIVIEDDGVKILGPGDIKINSASLNVGAAKSYVAPLSELPSQASCIETQR